MKGQVFRKTRACVSLEVVSASSSSSSLCGRFGLRKQRRGALASVGERERGCSKGAEYNTFRQRNVAVRGKFEDKDGKGAKRLKKVRKKAESFIPLGLDNEKVAFFFNIFPRRLTCSL